MQKRTAVIVVIAAMLAICIISYLPSQTPAQQQDLRIQILEARLSACISALEIVIDCKPISGAKRDIRGMHTYYNAPKEVQKAFYDLKWRLSRLNPTPKQGDRYAEAIR